MRKMKNVFLRGVNPAESMMVGFHDNAKARENGDQTICIDPICTTTA